MKISIFGTGYVGLISGLCFADFGLDVICVDVDKVKITKLSKGICPIYEMGADILLERNVKNNKIYFTTDGAQAIKDSEVIFIAVGTPPTLDGEVDLTAVFQVAELVGKYINGYKVVVDKSTVPVGTGQKVKEIIKNEMEKRGVKYEFDVVSNPEFLREGRAVYDFTHPDRIVLGVESKKAEEIMKKIYKPLYLKETPFVITNIETAEMIKYASNAFLATKIAFINEIANLCEKVGANVKQVAYAMGKDSRIGSKFLHAGPGYGGSCFPKDTMALKKIGEKYGCELSIVSATIKANERQKLLMVEKIKKEFTTLRSKKIAILGISFKPETDDIRESPAITIIENLLKLGANVKAYDPKALDNAKRFFSHMIGNGLTFCNNALEAIKDSDALVIVTEWYEFRNMDLYEVKNLLKGNLFFDLRNIYSKDEVERFGLKYIGVGT
ncbi:UDP-glucose dehydrogenase family protein [Thermosediminibacter litoriperuensis]|uniref:UDP-glucose 6-dehydrogenase n=1 Tax=Thermosediminibacter litoriperuensis TaxID=291989 RepID=A0A5S5AMX3_9FIRM|nr:UDP-glucose/GDP-mannose dehydrogenase family protein [Thermosediminibacter litoriperuensis]TYP52409.1 UDP-glucose dehydrogenase [Thermosediminibacter litoriperuensis]